MSRGKAHLKDVKAKALAELIAGDSPTEVSARYGLRRETVRNWKLSLDPEKLAEVSRNSGGRLDNLVCDYLKSGLESLTAQAEAAADPEWLRKQSGKDLAKLMDGISERTFRLLGIVSK